MASVGPLLVPGRSKYASTSAALRCRVRPSLDELAERGGDAAAQAVDQLVEQCPALGAVGVAVGRDHLLVDPPGHVDCDVRADREQRLEPALLLSVSRPAPVCSVRRDEYRGSPVRPRCPQVSCATRRRHWSRASSGQPDDVERVHDRDRLGQVFGGGGLEAGEPVHRDDLDGVAPRLGAFGKPGLERLLGPSLDHVQQPCRAGPVPDPSQVDDDGDVLVAVTGVAPDVLIDAKDPDAVASVRIGDQDPLALGQDRAVGGVPRHPEGFGDPRHRQVLADDRPQRPTQPTAREPGQTRRCRARGRAARSPARPLVPTPPNRSTDQPRDLPAGRRPDGWSVHRNGARTTVQAGHSDRRRLSKSGWRVARGGYAQRPP